MKKVYWVFVFCWAACTAGYPQAPLDVPNLIQTWEQKLIQSPQKDTQELEFLIQRYHKTKKKELLEPIMIALDRFEEKVKQKDDDPKSRLLAAGIFLKFYGVVPQLKYKRMAKEILEKEGLFENGKLFIREFYQISYASLCLLDEVKDLILQLVDLPRDLTLLVELYQITGETKFRNSAKHAADGLLLNKQVLVSFLEKDPKAVEAFWKISHFYNDKTYIEAALDVVEKMDLNSAIFARSMDTVTDEPFKGVLIGELKHEKMREILLASFRIYEPQFIAVPLDPGKDKELVKKFGYPQKDKPVMYLCLKELCAAPIFSGDEFESRLKFLRETKKKKKANP